MSVAATVIIQSRFLVSLLPNDALVTSIGEARSNPGIPFMHLSLCISSTRIHGPWLASIIMSLIVQKKKVSFLQRLTRYNFSFSSFGKFRIYFDNCCIFERRSSIRLFEIKLFTVYKFFLFNERIF